MVTHSLVKYEYQFGSFPQFRHYIECTCGFQSRLGTKEAVQSQFNAHLQFHGVDKIDFTEKDETVTGANGNTLDGDGNVIPEVPDWMKPKTS